MNGEETRLGETESVCPECLQRIPARRVGRGGDVFLVQECPVHGRFEAVLWRGEPDYASWIRPKTPSSPRQPFTAVDRGCPLDCGLCPEHRQHTCTALLEVTGRCDLGCAYCFASSGGEVPPDPSLEVIAGWYAALLQAGGPYNVQLSGGEPCQRNDLAGIVRLGKSMGFGFIQLNTNGLRLASDPDLGLELKDAGLSSVFLQFDGTEDEIYRALRGRSLWDIKRAAVERCAELELGVVLVPTLVPGVNVHNIGQMIRFALAHQPAVRGVHFQPVSYFGRFPLGVDDSQRVTLPEVMREIERQMDGQMAVRDFRPSGCENSHCSFHADYLPLPDGRLYCLPARPAAGCGCSPERAEEGAARTRAVTARRWSFPAATAVECGAEPAPGPGLGEWDVILRQVKTHTLTISAMAFQDAWTLDLERLKDCCIHTVHPDGRLIPFCAYNLTSASGQPLYRRVERHK